MLHGRMTIAVTLTNPGKHSVQWNADGVAPGYSYFRFLLVDGSGDIGKTAFHRMLRGEQTADDPLMPTSGRSLFAILSPGEKVVFPIDLSKLYNITGTGTYTLIVSRDQDTDQATHARIVTSQSQPFAVHVMR